MLREEKKEKRKKGKRKREKTHNHEPGVIAKHNPQFLYLILRRLDSDVPQIVVPFDIPTEHNHSTLVCI